jgi:hypothetical protein
MADIETKQVQSADALDFAKIERALQLDFEKRLHAVRDRLIDLLSHDASRDVLAALMGLDEMGRYQLLRHVVPDLSGPGTINGLEAIVSFVSYYVLDDGEVLVVPDVDPETEDVGVAAIMANYAGTGESPHEALRAHRERERTVTLVLSDESARAARGPEIIEAIRNNIDFELREDAAREAAYAALAEEDEPSAPAP